MITVCLLDNDYSMFMIMITVCLLDNDYSMFIR
jgi:hypothetical protein